MTATLAPPMVNVTSGKQASSFGSVFRKPRPSILGIVCFFAVNFMSQVDVNAIAYMMFQIHQVFSMVLLACCFGAFAAFQFRFAPALGKSGKAFVGMMIFFIVLGDCILMANMTEQTLKEVWGYSRFYSSFLFIALASTMGAYHIARLWGIPKAMMAMAVITGIQLIAMYALTWLSSSIFVYRSASMEQGRSMGGFQDPNQAGLAVAASCAVLFSSLLLRKHFIWLLVGIGASGMFCFYSFSRTALLAFMALAGAQIFISPIFKRKSALFAAVGMGGFMLWLVTGGYASLGKLNWAQQERMESLADLFKGDVNEDNTGGRLFVATYGLRYWSQSPVFGHGLGKGGFIDTELEEKGMVGPHNQFILMLIEGGIPAFAAFLWSWFVMVREAWRCKRAEVRAFTLGYLWIFFAGCMTLHTMLADNNHAAWLGVVFGFLAAARVEERHAAQLKQMGFVGPAH